MHPAIWCAIYIILGFLNGRNYVKSVKGTHSVDFGNTAAWAVISLLAVALCGYSLGVELVTWLS